MELDNIKDLWEKEQISSTPDISLEKQKEIRMPLEKIRYEMKRNFFITVFGIILLSASYFLIFENPTYISLIKWSLFIMIYCGITVYYFQDFYKLYRKLNHSDSLTKKFIDDLRIDLHINVNNFKSYALFSFPMIFSEFLIILPDSFYANPNKILKFSVFFIVLMIYSIYRQKSYIENRFLKPIKDFEILTENLK